MKRHNIRRARARQKAKRNFYDRHTLQRINERYGAGVNPQMITELEQAIRNNRGIHLGWQNKGTVYAALCSAGLLIVLYDQKKVVTVLPPERHYLEPLIILASKQAKKNERAERMLERAIELWNEADPSDGWETFEKVTEHGIEKALPRIERMLPEAQIDGLQGVLTA